MARFHELGWHFAMAVRADEPIISLAVKFLPVHIVKFLKELKPFMVRGLAMSGFYISDLQCCGHFWPEFECPLTWVRRPREP
jgi:hypothetical protein